MKDFSWGFILIFNTLYMLQAFFCSKKMEKFYKKKLFGKNQLVSMSFNYMYMQILILLQLYFCLLYNTVIL